MRRSWQSVIRKFLKNLKSFELAEYCQSCQDASMSITCFQLAVFGMSDIWRRCCLTTKGYPWSVFGLVSVADEAEFCSRWAGFRRDLQACAGCVDVAFTAPLLRTWNPDIEENSAAKSVQVQQLRSLLGNVATFCPLSTDAVENLHGQHQNSLFSWRGGTKAPAAAGETSVLTTLVSEHMHLKARIMQHTMPTKRQIAQIQRQVGRKKKGSQPLRRARSRLLRAARGKPKKLCAWNVFFRDKLRETKRKLSKQEFAQKNKSWARQWQRIRRSHEEYASYRIRAEYEQSCRDELSQRPLEAAAARKRRLRCNPSSAGSVLPDVAPDSHTTEHLQHIAGEAESWVIFELVTLNNNLNNII